MRRAIILILIMLLFCVVSYCQDTITIKHKLYSTTFSTKLHYPIKVEWWLTKKSLSCSQKEKRTNEFLPDPDLKDATNLQSFYVKTGYDRGHNFPAADASCDKQGMIESFYFSNMTPQTPQLNRGDWKDLEIYVREQAELHDSIKVWCGSVGSSKNIGSLSVPKQCWKVIYVNKTKTYVAYLFDNDNAKPDGFENNKVEVSKVEALTGYKFKL